MRRLMRLSAGSPALFVGLSLLVAGARAEFIGEPSGSGPYPATAETRPDLPDHTVYRPLEWPREVRVKSSSLAAFSASSMKSS